MHVRVNLLSTIIVLLLAATVARSQEQDTRLSVVGVPGVEIKQHWPGVFVRAGKLYVRWGELRPNSDTTKRTEELFYVLSEWSKRTEPAAQMLSDIKPQVLAADANARKTVVNTTTRSDPREFDGAVASASMQWRGDVVPITSGEDTVYKADFSLYIPTGDTWKKVLIYETRRPKQIVTLRARALAYNPNSGEILCSWVTNVDSLGNVTCIDTSGVVKWSFNNIPLPNGRLHSLIPIANREFIVVVDSTATRYNDGTPVATMPMPVFTGLRYQRLAGDRFMRAFVGPDTAHYTLELYQTDGTKLRSREVFRPDAQPSLFVTENAEDGGIGVVMAGNEGVYATVFDRDLTVERMGVRRVSRGMDTAFSPSAAFFGDTLYVAWQDNRNGVPTVYGRAFATGTFVFGVDDEEAPRRSLAVSVSPNPARERVNVEIDVVTNGRVDAMIVNTYGETVATLPAIRAEVGKQMLTFDVSGIPAGSYRVVVGSAGATATAPLTIVR